MGGGIDGGPSLLVGLPGRAPGQPLHAEVTSGTLLLSLSGPGLKTEPVTARGMRCISQARAVGGGGGQQPAAQHAGACAGLAAWPPVLPPPPPH